MALSRETLVQLIEAIKRRTDTHASLEKLLIRYRLEEVAPKSLGGIEKRTGALLRLLVANPTAIGPRGANLAIELLEDVLSEVHEGVIKGYWGRSIEEVLPGLINALRQDGYEVQEGQLVHSLPDELELPEAKSELQALLTQFGFSIPEGHLDQAIAAHTRSEWASSNANLRTYFEGLLEDIAKRLWPTEAASKPNSNARRELLAQGAGGAPPFFVAELNEWTVGGKGGFIRGLWERLHPKGSHPGLSDEEDSTFRMHLVLLTTRHLLRRLNKRVQ